MQFPLQITLRGVSHSAALEAEIRERAAKLEQLHPDIASCRVVVEMQALHHAKGREYRVHVDARLPGHEVTADHSRDPDVFVALRTAFESAHRRLQAAAPRG